MKKILPAILFFGSLWGIIEATLGWILHLLHFKGTSFLVLPFAIACMYMAIRRTGTPKAAFGVAIVAAAVKLTNLLPGTVPPYWVINPAVSILMEGIAFYLVYRVLLRPASESLFTWRNFAYGTLIFFAFQLLFCEYRMSIQSHMGLNPFVMLQSFESSIAGSFLQGLYRMGLSFGTLYLFKFISEPKLNLQAYHSWVLLFIAIVVTHVCI